MPTTNIREQDLHKFTKDLIDEAVKIDRPDREKICNFVLNLATNGGHRTRAALEAGYGSDDEAGKKVASSTAARLLENVGISSLYDKIFSLRLTSNIFGKLLEKEHRIALLYQVFFHCYEEKTHVSVSAFQEISKLRGDYEEDKRDSDIGKLIDRIEEINKAASMYDAFMSFHKLPRDAPPDKESLN